VTNGHARQASYTLVLSSIGVLLKFATAQQRLLS